MQATLEATGSRGEVQLVEGDQVSIRTETPRARRARRDQLVADLAEQAGRPDHRHQHRRHRADVGHAAPRRRRSSACCSCCWRSRSTSRSGSSGRWRWARWWRWSHDVIITAGIYALTGREVTPETVIALLTILGFSLYDTVVIYDKVTENTESPALVARLGYAGVVDLSLNQTVMRSVNTSLVVLLPILSLLLFGGETLKDFAFAMFVGVAIGAYSSIFIAPPVLACWCAARSGSARWKPDGPRVNGPGAAAAPTTRARPPPPPGRRGRGPRPPRPAARATAQEQDAPARQAQEQAPATRPSASGGEPVEIEQIKALIRDVPDFPEPGIVFKDITPVLADPIAFSTIIDLIVVHFGRGNVDKVVGDRGARVHPRRAGRLPLRRRVRAGPQAGQAPARDGRRGLHARVRDGLARDPRATASKPGRAGPDRGRRARDRRHREGRGLAGGADRRARSAASPA